MTSESSKNQYYSVAVLLFNGVTILDFAGPVGFLSHASWNKNPENPDRVFKIQTVAVSENVVAGGSLRLIPDLSIEAARAVLGDFDILIIPGAPPSTILPLVNNQSAELGLVKEYAALPPKHPNSPRRIFAVCTGAFFLGSAGILKDMTITTHHRALGVLRDMCDKANGKEGSVDVIQKRYVEDSPKGKTGLKILTTGGISSGLDAALHLLSILTNDDIAAFVARVTEYDSVRVD